MSSDLRYLDSSLFSEDSTLLSYQQERSSKFKVPRLGGIAGLQKLSLMTSSGNFKSTSFCQGKRPPRIPPLRTRALNSKLKDKSERLGVCINDDLFFLNEYKKAEIPRSRRTFNQHFPFWFQDWSATEEVAARKKFPEFFSLEETKVSELVPEEHNQWFRHMKQRINLP